MSKLVFKNREGDEIAPVYAAVLVALVLPSNLFLLSYCFHSSRRSASGQRAVRWPCSES